MSFDIFFASLADVSKQICPVSVYTLRLYDEMVGIWKQTYPPYCVTVCITVLRGGLLTSFDSVFSLSNHRPSQHGADLLSLLSKLLDENTKPGETGNHSSVVTVSLALQALEELCKAEV